MKKLLEDCLAILTNYHHEWDAFDQCLSCGGWSYDTKDLTGEFRKAGHRPGCKWVSSVASLRAELTQIEDPDDPVSAIFCRADQLEQVGDWRAQVIRAVFSSEDEREQIQALGRIERLSPTVVTYPVIDAASREEVTRMLERINRLGLNEVSIPARQVYQMVGLDYPEVEEVEAPSAG